MKKILFLVLITFSALATYAQPQFILKGKIEFERKTNIHKMLELEGSYGEAIKKSMPQFKTDYFDLYFTEEKTLYKPGKEVVTVKIPDWVVGPAADNVIFTDTKEKQHTSQKTFYESTFLLQDSLRKIEWKITADTRTIAGFECRKATAIIMDSIYVVAFYTDQILTSGGPESFTGLPGMILGVALPRLNLTYFASKLEVVEVKESDLVVPKKGKKITIGDLQKQLKTSMKTWGKEGEIYTWKVLI